MPAQIHVHNARWAPCATNAELLCCVRLHVLCCVTIPTGSRPFCAVLGLSSWRAIAAHVLPGRHSEQGAVIPEATRRSMLYMLRGRVWPRTRAGAQALETAELPALGAGPCTRPAALACLALAGWSLFATHACMRAWSGRQLCGVERLMRGGVHGQGSDPRPCRRLRQVTSAARPAHHAHCAGVSHTCRAARTACA